MDGREITFLEVGHLVVFHLLANLLEFIPEVFVELRLFDVS